MEDKSNLAQDSIIEGHIMNSNQSISGDETPQGMTHSNMGFQSDTGLATLENRK